MNDDPRKGIWLEVADARLERTEGGPAAGGKGARAEPTTICSVHLRADREEPKPIWWPVDDGALGEAGPDAVLKTYRAILNEIDKKRLVLARLTWDEKKRRLRAIALRFQSAELGSRSA